MVTGLLTSIPERTNRVSEQHAWRRPIVARFAATRIFTDSPHLPIHSSSSACRFRLESSRRPVRPFFLPLVGVGAPATLKVPGGD